MSERQDGRSEVLEARGEDPRPPIGAGTLVDGRYEVQREIRKAGMATWYLAIERATRREVALEVVLEEPGTPTRLESRLRETVPLAQRVQHPNVCRVHEVVESPWGSIVVTEHVDGPSLHDDIRTSKSSGGPTADAFRTIANDVCSGLAAIHAQGVVHGNIEPGNILVAPERAVILDMHELAIDVAAVRAPGAPPHGGTPQYMSPERLRNGAASVEDDVYAMALTLWEMFTCRVPEPGDAPRARPMREQILFDLPAHLSADELQQIFRALHPDPTMRPRAHHMRFWLPSTEDGFMSVSGEALPLGPPPRRAERTRFNPEAHALLVTYAPNAPETVGTLIPLDEPVLSMGRGSDQAIRLHDSTVSRAHATLTWEAGSWIVEDLGSKQGTYDGMCTRNTQVTLRRGAAFQVGKCRLQLVSFRADSPEHVEARRFLSRYDGLTGLLLPDRLKAELDEDRAFAAWSGVPMHLARFRIREPDGPTDDDPPPTHREMVALQKAARMIMANLALALLRCAPIVAGRTGPLELVASMVGPNDDDARGILERAVTDTQAALPEGFSIEATLLEHDPGREAGC